MPARLRPMPVDAERQQAFHPTAAVAGVAPYLGAGQAPIRLPHPERIAKLDGNECVRPPSPRVREALAAQARTAPLNWYPDGEAQYVRAALSDYTGLDTEAIRVFGGAGAALEYVARTFLEADDEVIWCPPSNDNFRVYAQSCGARLLAAQTESIWEPEPGALLSSMTPRTKMVYLVNPNNPTGTLYSADQLAALLWTCPEIGFVIDEAYFEFSGVTAAPLVMAHPNLMVVRSFANAFGLAGLRIGYLLSHPDNLASIDRIHTGENTSTLAQVAAVAALGDHEYLAATVAETRIAMRSLAAALKQMGLTVRTTAANFILVQVADPDTTCRFLANRLVFVRNRHHVARMEGYLRMTVGDMPTTERVIQAFEAAPVSALYGEPGRQSRLPMVRPPEKASPTPRRHTVSRKKKHVAPIGETACKQ